MRVRDRESRKGQTVGARVCGYNGRVGFFLRLCPVWILSIRAGRDRERNRGEREREREGEEEEEGLGLGWRRCGPKLGLAWLTRVA